MKQFSLEEYLKNPNKKVVTRDGRSVRIICTDRKSKNDYPIIALVEGFEGEEDFFCYPRDGKWPSCKNIDLFFAQEKHEGWINIYPGPNPGVGIYKSEEEAKYWASTEVIATIKIEWEE